MGRLIRYEWKKIWQSRMVQGAVLACSVFILFCIYMSIMQLETYDKMRKSYHRNRCGQRSEKNTGGTVGIRKR